MRPVTPPFHVSRRANQFLRVQVKFIVKITVCCRRRLSHTAILTVILTLARMSGAALMNTTIRA